MYNKTGARITTRNVFTVPLWTHLTVFDFLSILLLHCNPPLFVCDLIFIYLLAIDL